MLRITTKTEDLVPGNYTILVNITNSALVERTFFINIQIPFPFEPYPSIHNDTDFITGLNIGSHSQMHSVKIDPFGLIKLTFES